MNNPDTIYPYYLLLLSEDNDPPEEFIVYESEEDAKNDRLEYEKQGWNACIVPVEFNPKKTSSFNMPKC